MLSFILFSCGNDDKKAPSITIGASSETVKYGETISLTVNVKNSKSSYVWTYSATDLINIENNTLSVLKDVESDTTVMIMASLESESSVFAYKIYRSLTYS